MKSLNIIVLQNLVYIYVLRQNIFIDYLDMIFKTWHFSEAGPDAELDECEWREQWEGGGGGELQGEQELLGGGGGERV